jgi:hypothetical protein
MALYLTSSKTNTTASDGAMNLQFSSRGVPPARLGFPSQSVEITPFSEVLHAHLDHTEPSQQWKLLEVETVRRMIRRGDLSARRLLYYMLNAPTHVRPKHWWDDKHHLFERTDIWVQSDKYTNELLDAYTSFFTSVQEQAEKSVPRSHTSTQQSRTSPQYLHLTGAQSLVVLSFNEIEAISALSFDFWIYTSDVRGCQQLLTSPPGTTKFHPTILLVGGRIRINIWNCSYTFSPRLPSGCWSHIALVFEVNVRTRVHTIE